ncbi:reprolysin-like metallopeptidase [Flavobacterium piscis]|uniref:Subtilisin-like proprotein convertase family protein n=1 Tax=Flavobacterium piscis TaxID=1114874 RepID=A0ABU1Y5M5_9FLAO|nr:zinc-dependent metalloprotease family protein [Flavobacterium piscis]MDR7209522.1 subtilisin-like proprotein convertase family protein [Flavobacterium piscis]
MQKQLLFLFIIFSCVGIQAQSDELWDKVNSVSISGKIINDPASQDITYYKLNEVFLKQKLSKTTSKSSTDTTLEITIPNSDGVLEKFVVWESSNFEPELQAKYPEIRAYEGYGIDDKTAKIHFSFSPIGMQTMVLRPNRPSEFIEKNVKNKLEYVLFTSNSSSRLNAPLNCKTPAALIDGKNSNKTAKSTSNNQVLKTLRLALSCTGEYTAYFGGTKAGALAGMNATMTRVNGVFNKDLAVRLVLIANNDAVIYTDANTDPYSNSGAGADGAWHLEVQTTLTTVLGNNAYDIGHLFGGSGGGGDAGCIGCVCVNPTSSTDENAKGSAFTSPSNNVPEGDTFDIDYVAHEMGHQLGGSHTFSHSIEGTGVNVEPGSGSTIMGYAGVTNDYDIQNNSDDYFAYVSILEIQNNLVTKSCPVSTVITNNPPTINAGPDYTIPFSTPFILTGAGSDPDGDAITYCWEQNDSATSTSLSNSFAYPAKPDGPLFRSLIPSDSPIRYMPSLSTVLQNRLTTKWESVSSVARTLHFTLTGRDNSISDTPQTNIDAMIVTVNPGIGPFTMTSQNTTDIGWKNGSGQTITWSVNNTNTLAGSSNVDIKLSTDGGLTFPVILASNTPNDGSHTITVPADITATNCRILIQPVNNIYYALNKNTFAIGYTPKTTCDTYSFGSAFSIPAGNAFTTKTVNVPASTGTVSDVNVSVSVTHSRLSDVEIQIKSPNGTVVKLFDKDCGFSNSTLLLQYDDAGVALDCSQTTSQIVLPSDLLSAFNGENSQGSWELRVRDAVSGSFGTINSASVTICNQTFTLGVSDSDTDVSDFVLYPNPNEGSFTVQFESDSINGIEVMVYDILGQKIYNNIFEKTYNFNQNIQLSNPSSGLYLVTVIDGNRKFVKKIVVN